MPPCVNNQGREGPKAKAHARRPAAYKKGRISVFLGLLFGLRFILGFVLYLVLRVVLARFCLVLGALAGRPPEQSVVVTGRGGGSALQEIMDTVSEVREVKHAFKAGIKARKGVDY